MKGRISLFQKILAFPVTKFLEGWIQWSLICFWSRKQQPTPVFSPRKSHGQRSLVGPSSWGHKELDTTEHIQWSLMCSTENTPPQKYFFNPKQNLGMHSWKYTQRKESTACGQCVLNIVSRHQAARFPNLDFPQDKTSLPPLSKCMRWLPSAVNKK